MGLRRGGHNNNQGKTREESDIIFIRSTHVDYQPVRPTRDLTPRFGDSLRNPCWDSLKLAVPRSNLISAAEKTIKDRVSSPRPPLLNKEYRSRHPSLGEFATHAHGLHINHECEGEGMHYAMVLLRSKRNQRTEGATVENATDVKT